MFSLCFRLLTFLLILIICCKRWGKFHGWICLAMKGRIINCSPHKEDIYFLETSTKNEGRHLDHLFASPAGKEMLRYYKPRPKHKQKINSTLDFFSQCKSRHHHLDVAAVSASHKSSRCHDGVDDEVASLTSPAGATAATTTDDATSISRRSSLDLYEEAAAILGLTCAQTDDCRCIECQCHYFDFEEEIDFPPNGNDCVVDVDHGTSCSIQ